MLRREEGKGRGFLPSLQVTIEGRTRRHEQRKSNELGEMGKERQYRGREDREKRRMVETEVRVKEKLRRRKAERGERKKE